MIHIGREFGILWRSSSDNTLMCMHTKVLHKCIIVKLQCNLHMGIFAHVEIACRICIDMLT